LMGDQVLGFFQSRQKTPPIPGYYPSVMSATLVAEARAAIISRRTHASSGPKGDTFKNLFAGIIFCRCGAPMWFRDRGKKGGVELVCSSHRGNRGQCHRPGFNYEQFEAQFRDHVAEVDAASLECGHDEERETLRKDIANLGVEAEHKRKQMERLIEGLATASTKQAPGAVVDAIARYQQEVAALDRQREDKTATLAAKGSQGAAKALDAIKRKWPTDYAGRAALSGEIRRLVDRIIFDGEIRRVDIVMKGASLKAYFFMRKHVMPISRMANGARQFGPMKHKNNINRVEGWCKECVKPFDGSKGTTCPDCGDTHADRIIWHAEVDGARATESLPSTAP
jgi:Recombinase zinc beta ribbon domain